MKVGEESTSRNPTPQIDGSFSIAGGESSPCRETEYAPAVLGDEGGGGISAGGSPGAPKARHFYSRWNFLRSWISSDPHLSRYSGDRPY